MKGGDQRKPVRNEMKHRSEAEPEEARPTERPAGRDGGTAQKINNNQAKLQ